MQTDQKQQPIAINAQTWHPSQWQLVTQTYHKAQLAHAILISGAYGFGKFEFAKELAQFLLCKKPQTHGACGECQGCCLFLADTHPDITILEVPEDKQRIGIEPIRDITRQLGITAQIGPARVAIIRDVELLSNGAFNALLKTLEEPGRDTYLLLTCSQIANVPATVKSRCFQLPLMPVSASCAEAWLTRQGYDKKQFAMIWPDCEGAPLQAKAWLDTDLVSVRESFKSNLSELTKNTMAVTEVLTKLEKTQIPNAIDWLYEQASGAIRELISAGVQNDNQALLKWFAFSDQLLDEKRYCQINQGVNLNNVISALLVSWIELTQDLGHSNL